MDRSEVKNILRELMAEANAEAPAATVAPVANDAPDFLKGAKRGKAKAKVAEARGPRVWTLKERAVSHYGNPKYVFVTPTKNGGTFQYPVPADLADAIRAGKVRI